MRLPRVLAALLGLTIGTALFALPPAYLDSSRSGAMEGGILFSVDPLNGRTAIGVDIYWISRARLGLGVSTMFSLPHFPAADNFCLDGLYYLDLDSSGQGLAVVPLKAHIGVFGPSSSLGYGFAAGLEWYALPLYYDSNYTLKVSSSPLNCDTFATLKGLAEVDRYDGRWRPSILLGSEFAETIGGKSGQGYSAP